jgi:hypothetical protein
MYKQMSNAGAAVGIGLGLFAFLGILVAYAGSTSPKGIDNDAIQSELTTKIQKIVEAKRKGLKATAISKTVGQEEFEELLERYASGDLNQEQEAVYREALSNYIKTSLFQTIRDRKIRELRAAELAELGLEVTEDGQIRRKNSILRKVSFEPSTKEDASTNETKFSEPATSVAGPNDVPSFLR